MEKIESIENVDVEVNDGRVKIVTGDFSEEEFKAQLIDRKEELLTNKASLADQIESVDTALESVEDKLSQLNIE